MSGPKPSLRKLFSKRVAFVMPSLSSAYRRNRGSLEGELTAGEVGMALSVGAALPGATGSTIFGFARETTVVRMVARCPSSEAGAGAGAGAGGGVDELVDEVFVRTWAVDSKERSLLDGSKGTVLGGLRTVASPLCCGFLSKVLQKIKLATYHCPRPFLHHVRRQGNQITCDGAHICVTHVLVVAPLLFEHLAKPRIRPVELRETRLIHYLR